MKMNDQIAYLSEGLAATSVFFKQPKNGQRQITKKVKKALAVDHT